MNIDNLTSCITTAAEYALKKEHSEHQSLIIFTAALTGGLRHYAEKGDERAARLLQLMEKVTDFDRCEHQP